MQVTAEEGGEALRRVLVEMTRGLSAIRTVCRPHRFNF